MKPFPTWWRVGLSLIAALTTATATLAATPAVRLIAEDAALSVWDTDPTIATAAVQIANTGTTTASDVRVLSVAVRGGSVQAPSTFPVALGTLTPDSDVVLPVRMKLPATNGTSYLLTISGSYVNAGTTYGFSVNRYVAPTPLFLGPFPAHSGISYVKHPAIELFPPPPGPKVFDNNAEAPILIPPGPFRQIFPATLTGTPVGSLVGGAVLITTNTGTGNSSCDATNCSQPPDPSVAVGNGGNVVLGTNNRGKSGSIRYSLDGGATFTSVNLTEPQPGNPARTSFFPESDGGLCCDQVVIYLPGPNLFVWLLQYNPVQTATAITQANRLRIAWATPAAIAADFWNAWAYADLTGPARANASDGIGVLNTEWVDYPDLAFSDNNLYVAVDHGSTTPGKVRSRRIAVRMNIADIANAASPTVHYDYTEFANAASSGTGVSGSVKSHFVQGAPGRMVLSGLKDTSTLVAFTWRDGDGAPQSAASIPISSISAAGTSPDYTSSSADGTDWLSISFPGNITGGTFRSVPLFGAPSRLEYLIAFDAGRNAAGGRAQPYVRLQTLQLDGETLSNFAEYDIWNSSYAYGMAALATQGDQIGLSLTVGGGTFQYPQFVVGYKEDFVVYTVTSSDATQGGRYGDYVHVRPIPGSQDFGTMGYEVRLSAGGSFGCPGGGCDAIPRFVRFGRPPPPPIK